MNIFLKIMCFFGLHSGKCYDGAYRCSNCDYISPYNPIKRTSVKCVDCKKMFTPSVQFINYGSVWEDGGKYRCRKCVKTE